MSQGVMVLVRLHLYTCSSEPSLLIYFKEYKNLTSWCIWVSKIVSMIRKYHNHKLQTNLWHREEEPHNDHKTPGRQTKQSNQLSSPSR